MNYERKIHEDLNQLGKNKDCEIEKLKQKLEVLQKNIDTLTQQHDEALLRAENDKQQTLLLGFYYIIFSYTNNKNIYIFFLFFSSSRSKSHC